MKADMERASHLPLVLALALFWLCDLQVPQAFLLFSHKMKVGIAACQSCWESILGTNKWEVLWPRASYPTHQRDPASQMSPEPIHFTKSPCPSLYSKLPPRLWSRLIVLLKLWPPGPEPPDSTPLHPLPLCSATLVYFQFF